LTVIPQRNLSLLSNRLARGGGRRIPEAVLERDYCLAWFLVALARTPLYERLAFKGGTALKRCYFGDYRFSEDLDFTLTSEVPFEVICQGLDPVFAEARHSAGLGLRFVRADPHTHANSHTFYLGYEGPLPATAAGKEVKVDITIRERLVFPLEMRPVLRGYEEYEDVPEDARVRVYTLGEIGAEKVVALTDPARNEPRDLYDIWHLTREGHIDLADLVHAIEAKWAFRGKQSADARAAFEAKKVRYKKLWNPRLSAQMAELPEFDEVYRAVRRALRQAGLIEK
jgi:predicted nucleotidyltransferase component of viral defense system